MTKRKNAVAPVKRAPTSREAEAMATARERVRAMPVRAEPIGTQTATGAFAVDVDHLDGVGGTYQMMNALGTSSNAFTTQAIMQLANTVRPLGNASSGNELGAAFALIGAIAPENELEAALAVQMAAVHVYALDAMRRGQMAEMLPAAQFHSNTATKMLRTFNGQLEALGKLRRGGEQVVRHVHVYDGGQAVVAEQVNIGGVRNDGFVGGSGHATSAAMLGAHPLGHPLPVPGHAERAVSDARREVHGSAGEQE